MIGKAEIEIPIFDKMGIRGVVFTDVGNAYNLEQPVLPAQARMGRRFGDPCVKLFPLTSLRSSWGFGFRWFSPIGPLRFEWGIPYKPLPGEDSIVFEFTIGNEL